MQILIVALIIIVGILFAYIYKIKKEIKSIAIQLDSYNKVETKKKIDVSLLNKEVEFLAEKINKSIDIAREMKQKEINNNNELKDMISNISHDLRTPLTSIIGYIQVMKKIDVTKSKEEEYLNKIEKRAKDLQVMLEDFFKLSIIDRENYEIELEAVDINEILYETLIGYYDQFEELKIEPKINVKANYLVLGNKKEIKRIMENLLNNVIKHSAGDIEIHLEKNEYICLSIINSIKESVDENKIFDRFYKGNNNRIGKNTGLGLFIVKLLVEKMDGYVEAKVTKDKLSIICNWREVE